MEKCRKSNKWVLRFSRWVKFPWHVLQLATQAKSFEANYIIGNPKLNEMGLHVWRRSLADKLGSYRRRKLSALVTEAEKNQFATQGFFIRENALPEAEFQGLLKEIKELRGPGWEMRQGCAVTRRISLDNEMLATRRFCRQVVNDYGFNRLMHYAASFLGTVTFELQAIIVIPDINQADPQSVLHADTFHPTAKGWLFLQDVQDDEGPLSYVLGSHILTPERLAWEKEKSIQASLSTERMHRAGSFRITEQELRHLGLPMPIRFTVPANTMIIADTSGFHARCPSLKPSHRVEIHALLRRNPFIPWCSFHVLALPFIAGHHMAVDILRKKLLRLKGSWKNFDKIGAYDPANL